MLHEVTGGVLVHTSELIQNNSVAVRGQDGVLLVDAGVTTSEMTCLARDLLEAGTPAVAGFSTHPDWDHVLWHPDLGDVPRYGTARCAQVLRDLRSDPGWAGAVAEGLPPEIADDVPLDLYGLLVPLPSGTQHLPWAGPTARVVQHPAHSPGHAALLVDGPGGRVLVAGDMLSDVLVPMLDDPGSAADPLADYLRSLDVLDGMVDDVEALVPGHGSVCGPTEARGRVHLDRAYVHALRDGRTPDDPRIGASARPGWEWVSDVHESQVRSLARRAGTDHPRAGGDGS